MLRAAAELDGEIALVAGAFSSDPVKSERAGDMYRVEQARAYASLDAMLDAECRREDGIDFLAVAIPNAHHLPAARAALAAGIPVICDKPATATFAEAQELSQLVAAAALPFALTYTYAGYPLVREARARIAAGEIGTIRKVVVEYFQGWLAGTAEGKQAEWRVDPSVAGEGGCIGDLGVHAFHLAEFVTGLKTVALLADLAAVVPGRRLDDDCTVLLRYDNGARDILAASQISVGENNALALRVYGDRGSLVWRQESPNCLVLRDDAGGMRIVRAADPELGADARAGTRLPGGHPEGYLEALENSQFPGLTGKNDPEPGSRRTAAPANGPAAAQGTGVRVRG